MGIANQASALGEPFEFDGTKYTIKPLTYRDLAMLSSHLEFKARETIYRARQQGADADTIKQMSAALVEGVAAGRYETGGEVFLEAMSNGTLSRYTLQLMLKNEKGEPFSTSEEISYRVNADTDAAAKASEIMDRVNSDPLAVKQRKMPN